MSRAAIVLLILLVLPCGAPAQPPRAAGTLFAYQTASQYWRRHGSGPRIRVVATDVDQIRFEVRPLRTVPLHDGELDVEHIPEAALGKPVHQYIERGAKSVKPWTNPTSHLVHRGSVIEGDYTLPLHDDGMYVLTVSAGTTRLRYLYVLSPLGIVVNHTRNVVAGYAYDQKAQRPLAGADIEVWSGAGYHRTLQAGADGTFKLDLPRPLAERLTVVAYGKAGRAVPAIFTEGVYGRPYSKDSVYLFTDRPLYRGGHVVYYKGELDRGGALMPGQAVRVEVRDPANRLIATQNTTTNASGSFNGSVTLAAEAAPGDYNIVTGWGERRFYQTFTVRQYRKPWFEVVVTPTVGEARQGDTLTVRIAARGFSGMAVARGTAQVVVTSAPRPPKGADEPRETWEERSAPLLGRPEQLLTRDLTLDDAGMATIEIPTALRDTDQTVQIAATVQDAEHHAAGGSGSVIVTRAALQLGAWVDRDLVAPGEVAPVHLRAATIDGRPLATPLHVRLEHARWPKGRSLPEWSATSLEADLTTAANGLVDWSPRVTEGGYYRVVASASDAQQRPTRTSAFFWTSGSNEASSLASLEIISDRRAYHAGDTAHLLINSGLRDAWVYVSVEGSTVHAQQVVRLQGNSATVDIPVSAALSPGFYVHASIVADGQYVGGALALAVPDRDKLLSVSVVPSKTIYRPGEEASYTVRITDAAGRPVQTEFAMAVVDEALLALQADGTPDPRAFYYGRRQNEVTTGYSVPREVTGGAYQHVPGGPKPATRMLMERASFRDTAYWNPVLMTDADGTATVKVRLPDNLTRWKGTVRAVTPGVQVGMATDTVLARKDLMIRLATPRFFRDGDMMGVSAEVQNATAQAREVGVVLHAERTAGGPAAVPIDGGTLRTIKVPGNSTRVVSWKVPSARFEDEKIRFSVHAVDGTLSDAERIDVPVEPYGHEEVAMQTWRTRGGASFDDRFTLPAGGAREVTLRFAPSIAAAALGGVEALASYPYGCTEQTLSSFLPDVALAQVSKKLGWSNPRLAHELPRQVAAGLARLYAYQHADGGWGWWEKDRSDVAMTAWVLYGLSVAQAAGHDVAPDVLKRGVAWIGDQFAATAPQPFEARALVMAQHALVVAQQKAPVVTAGAEPGFAFSVEWVAAEVDKLDTFGLAMYADTMLQLERRDVAMRALELAWARGRADGEAMFFWPAGAVADDRFGNNDVEVTAAWLSVIARLAPDDAHLPRITRWLMQRRGGAMWGTTRTSAMVILALADAMVGELSPHFEARVQVNGRVVDSFAVTSANAVERTLTVPASALQGGVNTVRVDVVGSGALYGTRVARSFVARDPSAVDNGIAVAREWKVKNAQGEWIAADRIKAGEDVEVVLTVTTPEARTHVLLEDRLPSGFEVADADSEGAVYNRRDVLDDRIAFFFTLLPAGKTTVTWRGHAEQPGSLHVMPARAEMMYLPGVNGQTAGRVLEVWP